MEMHVLADHAMTSFKKVVLIARPRSEVFESLATRRHIPRWSSTLEDDGGPDSFEITGYEPPHRLTLAGYIRRFEAVVDYRFDELALGTLVTCQVEVDLSDLFLKGDLRVATFRIESAISSSLDRVKQLLETQDPT